VLQQRNWQLGAVRGAVVGTFLAAVALPRANDGWGRAALVGTAAWEGESACSAGPSGWAGVPRARGRSSAWASQGVGAPRSLGRASGVGCVRWAAGGGGEERRVGCAGEAGRKEGRWPSGPRRAALGRPTRTEGRRPDW
jgi:hypothetical protein